MNDLLDILHEDDDLLVLNKPAGLVCHPTKNGPHSSLIGRVRLHLGDVATAHFIHRLDRETGGVVVLARNAVAAGKLGRIWEKRAVRKIYLAIVHGHVREDNGVIDAPLGKDEQSRVVIKDCVRPDGAPAVTEYAVERRFVRDDSPFTFLRVEPRSGRKHQIRIHLSHVGHPIVGDKLYGGDEDLYLALVEDRLTPEQRAKLILPHHALHAASVCFSWGGGMVEFSAPPSGWFSAFVGEP